MKATWMMLAMALAVGCAEDAGKGTEEDPLTSGKDDSFYRPTEHGELRFTTSNPATISDAERFHAWTFTLSDNATVDISTSVSNNLDTVMYMYRRDTPGAAWGAYIQKNDDDRGKISSRIKLDAQAGEYRVVVKGFKSALRGSFNVDATCDGPGCAAPDTSCSADVYQPLPRTSDITAACTNQLAEIMFSNEVSSNSGAVDITRKCDLGGIDQKAVDFYHEWWAGFTDFDEQFNYGDGIEIGFQTTHREKGIVVELDAGGDEDGITFIFDKDENLLAMYQSNQSPTVEYYCPNGPAIATPSEDCFWGAVRSLQHDAIETSEGEGVLSTLTGGGVLDVAAQAAIETLGFDGAATATYVLQEYYSTYDNEAAAAVTLTVGSESATFYFASEWRTGLTLRLIEAGERTQFVCE